MIVFLNTIKLYIESIKSAFQGSRPVWDMDTHNLDHLAGMR